jgi:hypothetical protein
MLSFKKFIEEAWDRHIPASSWHLNKDKSPVDVYKNPSRKELHHNSRDGESRVWLHGEHAYNWHPDRALHSHVKDHMKLDNKAVPLHMYHDKKEAHIVVTDASRHGDHHHSPDVKDHIKNHPWIKRHFDHVHVSYYDDAIHGAWHKDKVNEDKVKLAREIAKRSKPRFVDIKKEKYDKPADPKSSKEWLQTQPSYNPSTKKMVHPGKHWSQIERERLIKNWSR